MSLPKISAEEAKRLIDQGGGITKLLGVMPSDWRAAAPGKS